MKKLVIFLHAMLIVAAINCSQKSMIPKSKSLQDVERYQQNTLEKSIRDICLKTEDAQENTKEFNVDVYINSLNSKARELLTIAALLKLRDGEVLNSVEQRLANDYAQELLESDDCL